jgi:hypothetical protein
MLRRAAAVCLLALVAALASAPLASAATERQAARAVASKLRSSMHKRADVRCTHNKGWFGCHFAIANRRNWTVGNAVVVYRTHRPVIRFFGIGCVGKRCPKPKHG